MSESMTIARALRVAKKLAGVIAERQGRLRTVSTWREERTPSFDFNQTLVEHDEAVAQLIQLRVAVARANALTTVVHCDVEMPLAEAIRRADELKGRATLFAGIPLNAHEERQVIEYDDRGRPVYETVRHVSVWTEAERAAKIQEIRDELELLTDLIEEANHKTRLS